MTQKPAVGPVTLVILGHVILLQQQFTIGECLKLKVHFMVFRKRASHAAKISSSLVENGLDPLVEPLHIYESLNQTSEVLAIAEFLTKVKEEPNSPTLQHVLIVYPEEPVFIGTYKLYQPIFDSKTLVLWYNTFMVNGTLGPEGTVVVHVDEHTGGLLVGERFCYLASSSPRPRRIQPLMYGYSNGYVRYRGFLDGIQQFCGQKGHKILDPIMLQKGTGWDDAARTAMRSVFIEDPSVDSVFCPDDDMATGVAQAASEVRRRNLSGLLLNGWQYGDANIPYLEQGLMYADVDASMEDLWFKIGQFLANINLQRVPRAVLSPTIFRVPSMSGLIKDELMAVYNRHDKPPTSGEVLVSIGFSLKALLHVEYRAKSFEILFDIHERWNDSRLEFSANRYPGKISFQDDEVWLAKYHLDNVIALKDELQHSIEVDSSGNVRSSRRLHAIFNCDDMELSRFPYDKHVCNVDVVAQYGLATMRLIPAAMSLSVSMGDKFFVNSVRADTGSRLDAGDATLSKISFEIELERDLSPYLVSHIVPGIIMVLLSTITFWLPETAVPARVTLCVIMLLTTMNTWASTPQEGTVMDKFFLVNIVFQLLIFIVSLFAEQKGAFISIGHAMGSIFGDKYTRRSDKLGRRVMPLTYLLCVVGLLLATRWQ